eukprot:UN14200
MFLFIYVNIVWTTRTIWRFKRFLENLGLDYDPILREIHQKRLENGVDS